MLREPIVGVRCAERPVARACLPDRSRADAHVRCDTGLVTWQWIAVAVIEALAVGFLVWHFVGPRRKPKILQQPDVKSSALVRKKKT